MVSRGDRQSAEYVFPYHHLPHLDERGRPHLGRAMSGGIEYLSYLGAVMEAVRELQPRRLLDVGCGDGRLLYELQTMTAAAVGVDLDGRAISYAASFAPGADFRRERVESVEGHFEVVTCVETLEHIGDADEVPFLEAVAARVAPGGHLVITVPSTARPVHDKHYRHYDRTGVRKLLEALPGAWHLDRLEEIVPRRQWLEQALRLVNNRRWTFDAPALNARVLALHTRPVRIGKRGFHVLAVARRTADGVPSSH